MNVQTKQFAIKTHVGMGFRYLSPGHPSPPHSRFFRPGGLQL